MVAKLSPKQLSSIVKRFHVRLHDLLQPLFAESEGMDPYPNELTDAAVADCVAMARWVGGVLGMLANHPESVMRNKKYLPNINEWKAMREGVCNETAVPNQDADLCELLTGIIESIDTISMYVMGAGDANRASGRQFLPTTAMRRIYKKHVLTYMQKYIDTKGLLHKHLMAHYAALYQAIATKTGKGNNEFYGKDFDDFMINVCNIRYNKSEDERGRYRVISDIRKACEPDLWEKDRDGNLIPPKKMPKQDIIDLYKECKKNAESVVGKVGFDKKYDASVPRGLDEKEIF